MLYIGLLISCVAGYIMQRVGSKKPKEMFITIFGKVVNFNALQLVGWIIMEGCCVAALVCKYVFKL